MVKVAAGEASEPTTSTKPKTSGHPPFLAGVLVSDPGKGHLAKHCHDLKGLYTPCTR